MVPLSARENTRVLDFLRTRDETRLLATVRAGMHIGRVQSPWSYDDYAGVRHASRTGSRHAQLD